MISVQTAAAVIIFTWLAGTGCVLSQDQSNANSAEKPGEQKYIWEKFPSGHHALSYYPEQALRENKLGAAMVECTFDDPVAGEKSVAIKLCEVMEEYPQSMGFGEATAKLIHRYARAKVPPGEIFKAGKVKIRFYWMLDNRRVQPESIDVAFLPGTNPIDYYPVKALNQKKTGKVKLSCTYKRTEGKIANITDCRVISETPKGSDFGKRTTDMFKERGRVIFGGPELLFPWEGEIALGYDWTLSAAQ